MSLSHSLYGMRRELQSTHMYKSLTILIREKLSPIVLLSIEFYYAINISNLKKTKKQKQQQQSNINGTISIPNWSIISVGLASKSVPLLLMSQMKLIFFSSSCS